MLDEMSKGGKNTSIEDRVRKWCEELIGPEAAARLERQQLSDDEGKRFSEQLSNWMREIFGTENEAALWQEKDDWRLVITLHAMVETALNNSIIRHLACPELANIIAKLDTSNTATGKVAFAKALKLFEPGAASFIQKLSEVRNYCVHDVRNFKFSLSKHLSEMGEKDGKAFCNAIARQLPRRVIHKGKPLEATELTMGAPRIALLLATIPILAQLKIRDDSHTLRDLKAELVRRKAAILDAQNERKEKE